MTTQPKNNNLDYLIKPKVTNINRLIVPLLKNDNNDPTRNCFYRYYMPLVEIKDFNELIVIFDQQIKKNKKRMKNLSKCQEMMTIQQEIYQVICIIKIIVNALV